MRVAFRADGQVVASANHDGTAKLWEVATGLPLHTLRVSNRQALAVAFSKNGKMLATGEFNGFVLGCLSTELAARNLRKQPVPAELTLKTLVYDKDNYQKYEARAEMRECPKYEDEIKN